MNSAPSSLLAAVTRLGDSLAPLRTLGPDEGVPSSDVEAVAKAFARFEGDLEAARTRSLPEESSARSKLRHDLRTPITQMIGYCELMQEELEDELGANAAAMVPLRALHAEITASRTELETWMRGWGAKALASAPAEAGESASGESSGTSERSAAKAVIEDGRVLVIDDTDANRAMLRRRLERDGFRVLDAESGERGLEIARQEDVDVILLDVLMPGLDGYETLQLLKSDPETHDLPVIMLTSLDSLESVTRCLQIGAEDHLPRPCDPRILRARISASLARKRYEDAKRAHSRAIEREKARADKLLNVVIPLGVQLAGEREHGRLLERTMEEARALAQADGAALYVHRDDHLEFVALHCESLGIELDAASRGDQDMPDIALNERLPRAERSIPEEVALSAGSLNFPNLYEAPMACERHRAFDARHGYRSGAVLAVPLLDAAGSTRGVLELWHREKAGRFDEHMQGMIESLSRLAGVALAAYSRELDLKEQIRALQIQVDNSKRARDVAEVTETDYFRRLRETAKTLRSKS